MSKIEIARRAIEDRVMRRRLQRELTRRHRQTQRYLRTHQRSGVWLGDASDSTTDVLER